MAALLDGGCPMVALPVTQLDRNLAASAVIVADSESARNAAPATAGQTRINVVGEQVVTRYPLDSLSRKSAISACLHGGRSRGSVTHARLVASRTILVDALYPKMRPISSVLSSQPYFVVYTRGGWLIWARAAGS